MILSCEARQNSCQRRGNGRLFCLLLALCQRSLHFGAIVNMTDKKKQRQKLVITGSGHTGKTALLLSALHGKYYPPEVSCCQLLQDLCPH